MAMQIIGDGMPTGGVEMWQLPWSLVYEACEDPLLAPLIVNKAGMFRRARGHWIERAWIDDYNLIYCIDGGGWLRYRGRSMDIHRGDLLVVPREAHAYGAASSDPWTIQWLHLRGSMVTELLALAGFSNDTPVRHIGVLNELQSMFANVLRTLQAGHDHVHLLHAANQARPLLSFLVLQRQGIGERAGDRIAASLRLMQQQINEPLTLAQLAAPSGLSVSHFSRRFREEIGHSPIDYFLRLKVDIARELLVTTDRTVVDIGRELGYDDPYHFSRMFKKIAGLAPTNYRRQHRGADAAT